MRLITIPKNILFPLYSTKMDNRQSFYEQRNVKCVELYVNFEKQFAFKYGKMDIK